MTYAQCSLKVYSAPHSATTVRTQNLITACIGHAYTLHVFGVVSTHAETTVVVCQLSIACASLRVVTC